MERGGNWEDGGGGGNLARVIKVELIMSIDTEHLGREG